MDSSVEPLYDHTLKYNYWIRSLFSDEVGKSFPSLFYMLGHQFYYLKFIFHVDDYLLDALLSLFQNQLRNSEISEDGIQSATQMIKYGFKQAHHAALSANSDEKMVFYHWSKSLYKLFDLPFDIVHGFSISSGITKFINGCMEYIAP